VRTEQVTEELSRNAPGAPTGGVPGALSNQPPQGGSVVARTAQTGTPPAAAGQGAAAGRPGAAAAAQPAQPAAPQGPDNTSKQANRTYEINRTVAYVRQPSGRLQRLSVAVLVDNLRTTDASGKTEETPLTDEQLARFTSLVKDAVGFDEKRGDSVSVVNQGFHPVSASAMDVPEMDKLPLWEQPMVRDLAKLGSGLIIVALLLLFVVRPLIRNLTGGGAAPRQRLAVAGPAGELPALAVAGPAAEAGSQGGGAPGAPSTTAGGGASNAGYDQQIAMARGHVTKDPARVAQVVKDWVQADD
jgi:flagellar M-ring protein FliF